MQKTDRIDAELFARFMASRPEAGRRLPNGKLRLLRALTTRRAQMVETRKRLVARIGARVRQNIAAELDLMGEELGTKLEVQIRKLEQRIAGIIMLENALAAKAEFLRSSPGIEPVCAAALISEMLEFDRMTAGAFRHPVLATEIGTLRACLMLLQNPDDVLFGSNFSLHCSSLPWGGP